MYDRVIWPERYSPKISAIYALNDIDVKAPPEVVWKLALSLRFQCLGCKIRSNRDKENQ
jgi:hypothetical protein